MEKAIATSGERSCPWGAGSGGVATDQPQEIDVFDSLRIRWKLGLVLALPVLALIAMTVVVVNDAGQEAKEAEQRADLVRAQAQFATASLGPGGVIDKLQDERAGDLARMAGVESIYDEDTLRPDTDKAIDAYRKAVGEQSSEVQEAYAPALAALEELPALRAEVDGIIEAGNIDVLAAADTLWEDYSTLIAQVYQPNTAAVASIDDPTLRVGAVLTDLGIRYKEGMADLATAVAQSAAIGTLSDRDSISEIADTRARVDAILDDINVNASGPYKGIVADTVGTEDYGFVLDFYDMVAAGEEVTLEEASGDDISRRNDYVVGFITEVGEQLRADADQVVAAAEQEADDASQQQTTVALVAGLILVLAVGAGLAASRSITRPLHRLTTEANAIAHDRLPGAVKEILDSPLGEDVVIPDLAQVPTRGGYEIAEVATALNTVQASAAELAVEQAVLRRNIADSFVNLGRRNQNLLDRQLDAITDMESGETDSQALERLFAIDHMATRMRRNAESLLLLAGEEPYRQWAAPVPILDVLRGALGEVEEFSRVQITRLDEVAVKGSSAADLTHMIAELLENALSFSPPTSTVEMATMSRGGRCVLLIVDNGVGMEPEDLALANTRLSGEESFTVAPSRYLGHYVVGIQAQRLGARVDLIDTPTGGITARLDITALLETEEVAVPSSADEETSPLNVEVPDSPAALEGPHGEPAEQAPAPVSAASASPAATVAAAPVVDGPAPAAPPAPSGTAAPAAPITVTPDMTRNGYRKRVRGANVPRTEVIAARQIRGDETAASEDDGGSTADSMRSMLSGLSAGTERGRADAQAERGDDTQTEEQS
jgi:signal transduction histidine kinase